MAQTIAESDNAYVRKYRQDILTLFSIGRHIVDPQMQMGAIDARTCQYDPEVRPMPWGGAIFSRKPPVDSEMIQRIVVRKEPPEQAWKWTAGEMRRIAEGWKAQHPNWKP